MWQQDVIGLLRQYMRPMRIDSKMSATLATWVLLCSTTPFPRREDSPELRKQLPLLVDAGPKHGTIQTLHWEPKATSKMFK